MTINGKVPIFSKLAKQGSSAFQSYFNSFPIHLYEYPQKKKKKTKPHRRREKSIKEGRK